MRVCFVSRRFFPAVSGMSVYAANLLRELVHADVDVTMISQYRGDEAGVRVYGGGPPPPVAGVRVVGLEALGEQAGGDFERDVETMTATILAEHARAPFDVLHAQYGYPNGWAVVLAAREIGVPTVVSIQGGDGHWVGSCCETHRLAMVRTLESANAVLIGGRSFVEEVSDRLGTDPDRFTIVPGAVDTARFRPRDGWRPGAAVDPAGPLRLLYHGRVDARKGALDTLDALAALRADGIDAALTVSGIGPDYDAARARAAALGLGEAVRFTGKAEYDDVPTLYREADLFLSPTYAEGFSNTILEAMASGLPVVAGRSVGVVDCLRDGENGVLVEPGDVAAIAAATARLARSETARAALASAALEECRRTYSWSAVGRRIVDVYRGLAGRAGRRDVDPVLPITPCRFRAAPHLL